MKTLLASTGWVLMGLTLFGCQPAAQPVKPVTATNAASVDVNPVPLAAAVPDPAQAIQPKKAQPGVAKQGRSLDNEKGVGKMIAQPIKTLFAFRERAVFTIQLPQALQLFEASEGRKPKSHQEFMDKVIKANQIQLPELPAGQEYNFHVDTGELWVHPIEPKS